jgi:hypothetical protein
MVSERVMLTPSILTLMIAGDAKVARWFEINAAHQFSAVTAVRKAEQ